MPTFIKQITRDNCLLIQEAWDYAQTEGYCQLLGIPERPDLGSLFYVTDGVVEIWESEELMPWIRDNLLAKNQADPHFLGQLLESFAKKRERMEKLLQKTDWNLAELLSFLELLRSASTEFVVIYYAGGDKRTPEEIRELALQFREKDRFYDDCDIILRQAVRSLFPQATGVEFCVLESDLRGTMPDKATLRSRYEHFVYLRTLGGIIQTLKHFAQEHPEFSLVFSELPTAGPLKGRTGSAGKAQGRVRIIKRKDQLHTFQEGEVLVSPMTTPDFVPAMQKAAAIVTDEGGIMCHAAIIARELKKPCVIGTKTATIALKDGEVVEVDANEGTIKQLAA